MEKFAHSVLRKCVINFTVIVFLHLSNEKTWSLAQSTVTSHVCKTDECRKLGAYYKENMNENVNPCDNFYDYVCHGWEKHHPKPKYEDIWTLELGMVNDALDKLRVLLQNKNVARIQGVERMKAVYKACMNLPYLGQRNLAAVKSITKKIDNWPMILPKTHVINESWWEIDSQYTKVAGESAIFNYQLSNDPENGNRIMLLLRNLYSPYGMLVRSYDWGYTTGRKDHYKTFLKKIIEAVAPNKYVLFKNTIEKDLEDVIQFREGLRKIILMSEELLKKVTIKEFQVFYNKWEVSKFPDQVDWLHIIRSIYKIAKDGYGDLVEYSDGIKMQKSYFEPLARFLRRHSIRVIANHIHLYFAERHVPLTPDMEAELRQSFKNDGQPSGKIRYQEPRHHWCIEHINATSVLGKMFAESYFPPKSKTKVEELVETAKKILIKQIMESNWLNDEAKAKSKIKVADMEVFMGFPTGYMENEVHPLFIDLEMNAHDLDAYYIVEDNHMYISAAYLQTPIYTPNVPFVVDYGSTMAVIGHEMYHAFDNEGIKYDHTGDERLWPTAMNIEHFKQTRCIQDTYVKQRRREYDIHGLPWSVTVPSTLNEDLADVMGIKLAYRAFKQKLIEAKGVCEVLPGFQNFGCQKLFFIAFANTLCATVTPAGEKQILLADKHNLQRIRVHGAVSNIEEFAAAFNCSRLPMNINKRCDLWKK